MDTLVLRSTYRGYASTYFWSVVWMFVLYGLNRWANHHIEAETFSRYDLWYPLIYLGYWLSWVVLGATACTLLYYVVYAPLEVNTFYKEPSGGWWKRLTAVVYDFPFSKSYAETFFDRVTDAKVSQSSIDRILGTGTIHLSTATFTNGEVIEGEWEIPAIEQPFEALATILGALPGHTGVEVRFRNEQPAAS